MSLAIPAMLGAIAIAIAIACALAETDDSWRHRLSALLITLACFAVAAFGVQWLLPQALPFAMALGASTFALVMLAAISGGGVCCPTRAGDEISTLVLEQLTRLRVQAQRLERSVTALPIRA